MLSFEQKLAILESFPELRRKNVSLGRVNFHYEQSVHEKQTVAYHLHPNGNGYVYGGLLPNYSSDDKGMVNVRDFTSDELRTIVGESIRSLSVGAKGARSAKTPAKRQRWEGPDKQTLTVTYEDELWYVYAGLNLEAAFETYAEVEEYMQEEGFSLSSGD
ncbi:hypothetical protein ACFFNY_23875 [Paenibacillus hodogayensis]|uniref:Uncharacterized protein n=1 Tax=Paenibacillus hodogayensis TaxID=279208 RepID=A0ABV5W225_9BACL